MTEIVEIKNELKDLRKDLSDFREEIRSWRQGQLEVCRSAARQREEHHKSLYGNGNPGTVHRLTRLEERFGIVWLGVTAFFGLAAKLIWDIVTNGNHGQ